MQPPRILVSSPRFEVIDGLTFPVVFFHGVVGVVDAAGIKVAGGQGVGGAGALVEVGGFAEAPEASRFSAM
jgi:hypothetical protein